MRERCVPILSDVSLFASIPRLPRVRTVPETCLAGVLFSGLLGLGLAGMIPCNTASASDFVLRTESTPLSVTIPVESTTLIRIENNRIRSAIFDKTILDIQTDQETGTVYVLPKKEGESTVYLTTAGGETVAVRLLFKADAPARTVVLEQEESLNSERHSDPDPTETLRPLAAAGFSADVKRMISLVLRGETATGEILKSQRRQAGPAATRAVSRLIPVKARLVAVWRSEGIEASHFILRNGGIRPIALDPRALSVAGIYAVGLTSQRLMPGETTDLILVEADRGDR